MIFKKKPILIISVLCILSLLLLVTPEVYASPAEQLESIQREREQTRKQIEEIEQSESDLVNQITTVEDQYLNTLSELEDLNLSLENTNHDIEQNNLKLDQKNDELEELEDELEQKVQLLNKRAASIYKHGNINLIELLAGADSFIEFFAKIKLMNLIAQEDINIINDIKEDRAKLLMVKKNIIEINDKQEENKKELERLLSQTETKSEEIETIYNEKKELLNQTQQDKAALVAMDRLLTAKENAIKNTLRSLTYGTSPTGKLLWPTNGRLSSGFGPRRGRFHSGIDIYCPRGTPIIAADTGQVIQTGYHGGYGNFILIYHGGSFATFYAHLDGFAVSGGQNVTRGQTIGYVGTTGWTTGPHLHFEVRINGVAKNPMNYF